MKTRRLKRKAGALRCLICMLLTAIMFIFTKCSNEDDDRTVYTVTFETDGGTPVPSVQRVEEGSPAIAPSINPSKAGYVFVFWHLGGAATPYSFQTPVNRDITLQAKWQEEATAEYWQVTWNLNGGIWAVGDSHATQVVKGGTLAEPVAPTKEGQVFDGWYKEVTLTNKINFPYNVSAVTANFTLYAKWTKKDTPIDPIGYKMFTSIAELKSWIESQPVNTVETPYKVGLKNFNLDDGDNWTNLGVAIDKVKFVDLNLQGCTGTTIPDGRIETTFVGNKVTTTYYGAFVGCRLTAITLPENLKVIGKVAFNSCKYITSITLPSGLEEIRDSAFDNCTLLSSVSLPNGLKIIGKFAFSSSKLTSITIPGSVKNVENNSFSSCGSLTSVILEEGVENIGYGAFMWCPLLKSVLLPSGLQTIGEKSFSSDILNPSSIATITIPASVTRIDQGAFYETHIDEVIMLPTVPPVILPPELVVGTFCVLTTISREPVPLTIKVPAASLNAYKTASGWSSYSSNIIANN